MIVYELNDLRQDYAKLVNEVLTDGDKVAPRGMVTYEQRNVALVMPLAGTTYLAGIGRNPSKKIFAAELCQWVSGTGDLTQLKAASANRFANFSDDGTRLYGAYGPRARAGLERAVRLLGSDDMSRQATASIWRNDETDATRDLPCTLSWSFMVRRGRLHMTTMMRSNDLWTGVAYDVPIMGRIGALVAACLGVELGTYTHIAQSFHLYESDVASVDKLTEARNVTEPPLLDVADVSRALDYVSPTNPSLRWAAVREWATRAVAGDVALTGPFGWYRDVLAPLAHNLNLCGTCHYWLPQPELFCIETVRP